MKVGVALLTVLPLGAATASNAVATPSTAPTQLYIAEKSKLVGYEENLICSAGTAGLTLMAPRPARRPKSRPKNSAARVRSSSRSKMAAKKMVEAAGKLVFSELEVLKPVGCETTTSIETAELKARIFRRHRDYVRPVRPEDRSD
jgi:hypothetical protein